MSEINHSKWRFCAYCGKPFLPGHEVTSNENEDVVHMDCEEDTRTPEERKRDAMENEGDRKCHLAREGEL
jgi:hypothetical protein